jgi:hypothetical protein
MRERVPVWTVHVGHLTNPSRESLARPLSFLLPILFTAKRGARTQIAAIHHA